MKKLVSLLLVLFQITLALAQDFQIKNVKATQQNNQVIVQYDLDCNSKESVFEISVFYSDDLGTSFSSPLTYVSGDVGSNIKSGIAKKIIWDVLKEKDELAGDLVFKVRGKEIKKGKDLIENFVYVEGGTFLMGSDFRETDEKPAHRVELNDFYIGSYEITVDEYYKYCLDNMNSMPVAKANWSQKLKHPMTNISWDEANNYCKWLSQKTGGNYRLPTEAEWEYAAKGGKESNRFKFSGNDNAEIVGWMGTNANGTTNEVGKLVPNELGIYDMTGNVWEWCSDWYSGSYYSQSEQKMPTGPASGKVKVGRGGSWRERPTITTTSRYFASPTSSTSFIGFRIVMEK